MELTITNSTISGLHVTKKGSHPSIELQVLPDPSRQAYDQNCMKVVCPPIGSIPIELHEKVVWPRNPTSRRYTDILVKDVAGTKIGHVPAHLCGLLKTLLDSGCVTLICCHSTGEKPRRNSMVPHDQSFAKGRSGTKDRRGGGVVLDCKYNLHFAAEKRSSVVRQVEDFLESNEGCERYHC